MNIECTRLVPGDTHRFIDLVNLFAEVFEMQSFTMPPKAYLRSLLLKPDFIVFVAMYNNKVIGGLTAYVLQQYYAERPLAYLYDLAVKRDFQRQGVGRKLVADLNRFCRAEGFQEVFVQADKVDDYAIDFYRKTSITAEEQVVHFYYSLQERF